MAARAKSARVQAMSIRLNRKGQVTIPKHIRDALGMLPGCLLDAAENAAGDVVVRKASVLTKHRPDRFEAARPADDPWQTLEAGLRAFEPGFALVREQPEVHAPTDTRIKGKLS